MLPGVPFQVQTLPPTGPQAFFRGARAALQLQEYDLTLGLCQQGLAIGVGEAEAQSAELLDLQKVWPF